MPIKDNTAPEQESTVKKAVTEDEQEKKPLSVQKSAETKDMPKYEFSNNALAAMGNKVEEKLAKLTDKKTALTEKKAKNDTKIKKWQAKIEDAQTTKSYCTQLVEAAALPKPLAAFFQNMADRQESKITSLNNKIAVKQGKNKDIEEKISKVDGNIAKQQQKLNKYQKVDKFLTNMKTTEGRRENFITGLQELKQMSLDSSLKKYLKVGNKIAQKELALTKATSATEKFKLRNSIANLEKQYAALDEKITKLQSMTGKLEDIQKLTAQQTEQVIESAVANINHQISDNQTMTPETAVDTVINETGKAVNNNQIDQQIPDKEQAILAKLQGEIADDVAFFGEITLETAQHIKQAGYELNNGNLQKMQTDPFYDYQENGKINEQMKQAVKNSNGADKMSYHQITEKQAELLKSVKESQGLEFAVFDAKPDTNNEEKISGFNLVFRESNRDKIFTALDSLDKQKGQENPLQNVETAVEQNANNIDGVINNLPATTVLFSVEQYDTVRNFIADNISVKDLLSAANDDKAFQALSNMGKPISEGQFADIQQSDKFNYSVEINLNEKSANFYVVNGGKGGIPENDRTDKNTNFFSVKISDYKDKAQQKGTQQHQGQKHSRSPFGRDTMKNNAKTISRNHKPSADQPPVNKNKNNQGLE